MNTSFIRLTIDNIHLLDHFLRAAGENTLISFRYFNNRPKESITNHIVTYLLIDTESSLPIGYGHLDPDGTKVWLGIAVIETWQGRGTGRKIMLRLLQEAANQHLPKINLTVDKNNIKAIKLYDSMGFVKTAETDYYYEFEKDLLQ